MITGFWLVAQGRLRPPDGPPPEGRFPSSLPVSRAAHRGELRELRSAVLTGRTGGDRAYLWLDLVDPTNAELAMLSDVFDLPARHVEDAAEKRGRPKVERLDLRTFLVMKSVSYLDATSDVETHQVVLFLGHGYLITISHGRRDIAEGAHERLAREPRLFRRGALGAFYAVIDTVVDEYVEVAGELAADLEALEESVFSNDRSEDSEAIYRLKRETLELRRAAAPLAAAAGVLQQQIEDTDPGLVPYFKDVGDNLIRVAEYADNYDQLLVTMLNAFHSRLGVQQNEDMRRISAYVALAAVPTLIAGIYGMNFEAMPELDEPWGYPFALGLMAAVCLLLYRSFKRSGWL